MLLCCVRDLTQDTRAYPFSSLGHLFTRDRSEPERGSFVRVHHFKPIYLPGLRALVNNHLSAVVPGWALSDEAIAAHLEQDHDEPITDPWVVARATLLATEGWYVLAAAHLLRYGDGEAVGEHFRGVGEIGWLLCVPESFEATAAVLSMAREQLSSWGVRREEVCSGGLPVPAFGGVPDCWPHVSDALKEAGYVPGLDRREALYGGTLAQVREPGARLLPDFEILRTTGKFGVRFSAVRRGEKSVEIGHLECVADLTKGGTLPAFGGWAELAELWVREDSRNRGIGSWLVEQAVSWLRLAGCDRIVISVDENDETTGAGRFYHRFGWEVFAREIRSWSLG